MVDNHCGRRDWQVALGEHEWASVTVKRTVGKAWLQEMGTWSAHRALGEGVAATRKSQAETAQCERAFCVWAA